MERRRQICRFYQLDRCVRPNCPYLHVGPRSANPCRNFVEGFCRFGRQCRYAHPPNLAVLAEYNGADNAAQHGIPLVQPLVLYDTNNTGAGQQAANGRNPNQSAAKAGGRTTKKFVLSPNAKPFVPQKLANQPQKTCLFLGTSIANHFKDTWKELMCPYFEAEGVCKEVNCPLIHGDKCDMCDRYVLHPSDQLIRSFHNQECIAEHEKAMAEAFANQLSAEKQCGICMENVHEQTQRFGILNNCKHCYCLPCIRSWRKTTGTVNRKTTRSCPECRVVSDFVIPSAFWVEDETEKKKLIDTYTNNMKSKICKYMSQGNVDDCPFGNKCFYKHQLPDGRIVQAGAPHRRRRPNSNDYETLNVSLGDMAWLQRVHISWVPEEDGSVFEEMWHDLDTDDEEDDFDGEDVSYGVVLRP